MVSTFNKTPTPPIPPNPTSVPHAKKKRIKVPLAASPSQPGDGTPAAEHPRSNRYDNDIDSTGPRARYPQMFGATASPVQHHRNPESPYGPGTYSGPHAFVRPNGQYLTVNGGQAIAGYQTAQTALSVQEVVLISNEINGPKISDFHAFFDGLLFQAMIQLEDMKNAPYGHDYEWSAGTLSESIEKALTPFVQTLQHMQGRMSTGLKPTTLEVGQSVGMNGHLFYKIVNARLDAAQFNLKAMAMLAPWVDKRPELIGGNITNFEFSDFILTNHGLDGYLFTVRGFNRAQCENERQFMQNNGRDRMFLPSRVVITMQHPISFAGLK